MVWGVWSSHTLPKFTFTADNSAGQIQKITNSFVDKPILNIQVFLDIFQAAFFNLQL